MESAYTGAITPQLYDGSTWYTSQQTIRLQVTEPTPTASVPAAMAPAATPIPAAALPGGGTTDLGDDDDTAVVDEDEDVLPLQNENDTAVDEVSAEEHPAAMEPAAAADSAADEVQATAAPTAEPTARPALTASSVKASDPSLVSIVKLYGTTGKQIKEYNR